MTPPSTDPLFFKRLRAWTEGALSTPATQALLADFTERPVWFPGTRQTLPEHPGKSLHRLHPVPGGRGELPMLPVWFEDPAQRDPPDTEAMLQYHAGALLVFAMTQRFNVRLEHAGASCVLLYEELLNLRTLMLLNRLATGQRLDAGPAPSVDALVPVLRSLCRSEPAVRRAWLALVSSPAACQATVMIDAPPPTDALADRLVRHLDALLPPGVALNVIDTDRSLPPEIRQAMRRLTPIYDVQAKLRWLSRWRDKIAPTAVPVVALELRAEAVAARPAPRV